MKIVGTNKTVVLTRQKAEFWLSHQANQRAVIDRHAKALAKLLSRVGWRNDQRICITEDDSIINGLQRLSAIVMLNDFGWNIPVTVFKKDEITNNLIESFNVQKSDSSERMMRRLYGWVDRRMTNIAGNLWRIVQNKQNPTTVDLLSMYEGLRVHIDKVMSVSETKKKGYSTVPTTVNCAAALISASGVDIGGFLTIAKEYVSDNKGSPFWRSLKEWDNYWRGIDKSCCAKLTSEPGSQAVRVARVFISLKSFLQKGKPVTLKNIRDEELSLVSDQIRSIVNNNI